MRRNTRLSKDATCLGARLNQAALRQGEAYVQKPMILKRVLGIAAANHAEQGQGHLLGVIDIAVSGSSTRSYRASSTVAQLVLILVS